MCGRYALTKSKEVLEKHFDLFAEVAIPPRYNAAPTDLLPIVRDVDGKRQLELFRWGLLPPWAPNPAAGAKMINARSETVQKKGAFRPALERRRCLVPADGFYEWERRDGRKWPVFIGFGDRRVMAMAGLWERWMNPSGPELLHTFTVLTTAPNERVRPLHDRMPVILDPADYDRWLDTSLMDPCRLDALFRPYPGKDMVSIPVNPVVNDVKNDGPSCLEPRSPEHQPQLRLL